jgi:hypothetical protein
MAITKLIKQNLDGSKVEYAGKSTSAGAGDAGDFVILGSGGKLDPSLMPNGVGADAVTVTAGEALNAGDFVYFSATGTALKADATSLAKGARGYTLAAVSNGSPATIYFDESNSALTGLTAGATYYLSTTPGQIIATAPATVGQIVQEVGFATSATNLHVNILTPITRA